MKKYLCILLTSSGFSLFAANHDIRGNDSIPCVEFPASAGPDHTICAGESVTIGLDHGGLSETSGYIFSWAPAAGLDDPGSANPIASPAQTTTYILTLSHRDNDCISYDTVQITVKQPANLMFFPPGPHYICDGQQVTLTGAFGFSNYRWDGPTGELEGRIVQVNSAGIYRLSATDAQGCRVQADSFELHVRTPLPLATNPSGIKKICAGQTAQLAAAQGFIAYNWHTPTGTIGGRFITATVPGNYHVTATDANSCLSTSATLTLEVNTPAPIVPIHSGSGKLCPGESVMLTAPEGFSNYFWIGPSGQLSGKNILVSQPGSYQLKAFDQNACLSVAEPLQLIAVEPVHLEIRYEDAPFICRDTSKQLEATFGFSQYSWTLPTGSVNGLSILAETPGIYQVSAIDSNGCTSVSGALNLKAYPYEVIHLNLRTDTSICQGDTLRLIPEEGHQDYRWHTPFGAIAEQKLAINDAGTYRVTARDSNGCIRSSESFVLKHFPVIRPVVISNGRDTLCPGDARRLTCSDGFTDLRWNTPAGTTENESLETNVGGVYSVTAKDSNGCSASSLLLLIHESFPFKPEIHVNVSLEQCAGEEITISADTGFASYQWSNGSTEPFATIGQSGSLNLEVRNRMGCVGYSDTIDFNFREEPVAEFTYDQVSGLQGIQFLNQSESAEAWHWDFGDGHSSQEEHPVHVYSSRGNWSVSLVVENFCGRDTIYRELKVDPATGLEDQSDLQNNLQIYPNPGDDRLLVELGNMDRESTLFLLNQTGQVLVKRTFESQQKGRLEIDTRSLASGIYTVVIEQGQQRTMRRWAKR